MILTLRLRSKYMLENKIKNPYKKQNDNFNLYRFLPVPKCKKRKAPCLVMPKENSTWEERFLILTLSKISKKCDAQTFPWMKILISLSHFFPRQMWINYLKQIVFFYAD